MKPGLQLRTSQGLALTPQLKLAIKILQYSSLELEQALQESLESNPLLDLDDEFAGATPAADDDESLPAAAASEKPVEIVATPELGDDWESFSPDLGEWHDAAAPFGGDDDFRPEQAATRDLRCHLTEQLDLMPLSPIDRLIAEALVDGLDEDGYLRVDDKALIEAVASAGASVDARAIGSVRQRLLKLDPTGVGARSLAECLLAQLDECTSTERELATTLVREHLADLARRGADIARRLGCEFPRFERALELIRSLDPKPGARFSVRETIHAIPDIEAFRVGGRWRVRLLNAYHPRLGINAGYAALARGRGGDDWTRTRLNEARWLIRSVAQREETLLKVTEEIVARQDAFLEFGDRAMRPMAMRDVAAAVGVHESTISRAVANKYLATPRGTVDLRRFFTAGLQTSAGGEASSTAIQALLKQLIHEENSSAPLSDQALVEALKDQGIVVARRTVAKYREALGIPSSHERARG